MSTLDREISFPVQYNNFRSRLRTADSALHDWQPSCTDTAEVVHHLVTGPRVYAEYQADGLLPVGHRAIGRDLTTFCLELIFHWAGTVHGPAHAQSTSSEKLPNVARTCQPEVKRLIAAINETNAVYLSVRGSAELVVSALKCIPLEKLPIHVVSVDCHDVTSGRTARVRLGLNHVTIDRWHCLDEMAHRGWSLHTETARDFVFVRRIGVI